MNRRNHLLALWIENRLGERGAVIWAVRALRRTADSSSQEVVSLLDYLAQHAEQDANLTAPIKLTWHMLRVAAHEHRGREQWWRVEEYRRKIDTSQFFIVDASRLVDFVWPRLTANEPPMLYIEAEDDRNDEPQHWVSWDFESASGTLDHTAPNLTPELLAKLPAETLSSLIDAATTKLDQALAHARQLEWREIHGRMDHIIFRVAAFPDEQDGDDGDLVDRDPDAFNDDFAPIIRLITVAFDALAATDPDAAARVADRWGAQPQGIHLRLAAYAAWNPSVRNGDDVARLLNTSDERAFWNRNVYPEVASLRAQRWKDIPAETRSRLAERLITGPTGAAFQGDDTPPEAIAYARDLELARIVDQGAEIPDQFARAVTARRTDEPDFPRAVSAIERGPPGLQTREVPGGNPATFEGVSIDELVDRLADSSRERFIGEGDQAEAFARLHRDVVLEALQHRPTYDENAQNVWHLMLSWPHEKPDDLAAGRRVTEGIATLALSHSGDVIPKLANRLSYWLDAADEQQPDFAGAGKLWASLLPHAVDIENRGGEQPNPADDDGGAQGESDISGAALNAPLGQLLAFFLRRCPSMPSVESERLPLPAEFADPLKMLTGRARALVANRLVVHANYFARADRSWLDEFVLEPMRGDSLEGRQLWEAFARYAQFPMADLWAVLQDSLLEQLAPRRLSDEAQRQLMEIAIIAWAASKRTQHPYAVDAAALRRALTMCTEEVRSAAAWRFANLLRPHNSDDDNRDAADLNAWSRLGALFFDEVWPIEPALQSGKTADDFARLPVRAGARYFVDAVAVVLPYLRPVELWDVETGLGLNADADPIVQAHPTQTLALINACVGDDWGPVFRLDRVLRVIREASPELEQDPRMRRLLRHAEGGH